MIRGGNGKLKGRRNRRPAKCQRYVWRRIKADMAASDWRFSTRLFYVDDTPRMIQVRDIQDALKW